MSTTFYLTDEDADIYSPTSGPYKRLTLGTKSDNPSIARVLTKTFAGPTLGSPLTRRTTDDPTTRCLAWISDPVKAITLSTGSWTLNLWAGETVNAHASLRVKVSAWRSDGTVQTIFDTGKRAELSLYLRVSAASIAATATTLLDDDRILVECFIADTATLTLLPNGVVSFSYNGLFTVAEGDSFLTCPDDLHLTADLPEQTRAIVRQYLRDVDPSSMLLQPDDIDLMIARAVNEYSQDRSLHTVASLSGDGVSSDFPLPRRWTQGLSLISHIEYPLGGETPFILNREDWTIYRGAIGSQPYTIIRFSDLVPDAGIDNILVSYTTKHVHTSVLDTVPQNDYVPFCQLAASHACLLNATKAAGTSDTTISADSTNYRDAQTRWSAVAKQHYTAYKTHIGQGTSEPGSGASVQYHTNFSWGMDRLFHQRKRR